MDKTIVFVLILALCFGCFCQPRPRCPDGCALCPNGERNCSTCFDGFLLNNATCFRCSQGCLNCQLGTDNKENCTLCANGGTKDFTGKCYRCAPQCNGCYGNPQNCTACNPGDTLINGTNGSRSCQRGSGCNTSCLTCNVNGTCATCPTAFYLAAGACRKCRFPCDQCSLVNGTQDCTSCVESFFDNGTNCAPCPPNCLECSSNTVCTSCRPGFYTNGSTVCNPCTRPCSECDGSPTTCTACKKPRTLISSQCVQCSAQCLTCDVSNNSLCTSCKGPFSLFPSATTNACYRCSQDLCDQCSQNATTLCVACKLGAGVVNGLCFRCPPQCIRCQFSTNGTIGTNGTTNQTNINSTQNRPNFICKECAQRRVLINGICQPCAGKGCLQCDTDRQTCLTCQDGSFNERGICRRCTKGCQLCESADRCLKMVDGYVILNNGLTVRCRPGCNRCNAISPEKCLECAQRFYADGDNCKKCGPKCLSCNSGTPNFCTRCRQRDTLQNGTCISCDPTCLTCSSSNITQCASCRRGLVLTSNNACVNLCEANCLDCKRDNTTQCLQCRHGFALREAGVCVKCLGDCGGRCDPRDLSICLDCKGGFQLNNGTCLKCPPGCARCKDGQCDRCIEGFDKVQNTNSTGFNCTRRCRFPCATCNETTCFTCVTNFVMNSNNTKCIPDLSCNPNCTFCPPGSQKLANGSCTLCTDNCAACGNGTCFECVDGFYQSNGTCVSCPDNCFTCVNNDTCLTCKKGFLRAMISEGDTIQTTVFNDSCTPCDSNCQSCDYLPSLCTDCSDNKTANGSRCLSRTNVRYNIKFKNQFSEFISNGRHQTVCQKMSGFTKIGQDDVVYNGINDGSSITIGNLNIPDGASPSDIASLLESNINNLGLQVLSYSVGVYDESGNLIISSANIPLIVGLAVGLGGFLIIVIIVAIVCVCIKKKDGSQLNPHSQEVLEGDSYEMKVVDKNTRQR